MLVTSDGWVKRQKEINPETTRLREGDRILSLVSGSTRATIAFFSNFGTVYTARIIDIPATTGYGEPIQKLFKPKDGEKIISAISMDERVLPLKATAIDEKILTSLPNSTVGRHQRRLCAAFGLDGFREVSTRSGRHLPARRRGRK